MHTVTNKTGLLHHTMETGYVFNYDNTKIIDRESNQSKRKILESTHPGSKF